MFTVGWAHRATETIGRFLRDNPGLPTPFLVVDLDLIEARYCG